MLGWEWLIKEVALTNIQKNQVKTHYGWPKFSIPVYQNCKWIQIQ
jgi:hypothetical protein